MEFEIVTSVNARYQDIRDGFGEGLFRFLVPAGAKIISLEFGGCEPGATLKLNLRFFGILRQSWHNTIVSASEGDRYWEFTDHGIQMPFPISSWRHRHMVEEISPGRCLIRDQVHFTTSPAWLAKVFLPAIRLPFQLRRSRYRKFFRHQEP